MNNILVILIIGASFLLGFILLTNPKKVNAKANRWFGISILMIATFSIEELLMFAGMDSIVPSVSWIVRLFQVFTPLFYFLSVSYYADPQFKYKHQQLFHLIAPVAFDIAVVLKTFYYPESLVLKICSIVIILSMSLYYTIVSLIKINQHQKRFEKFSSEKTGRDLKWLQSIFYMLLFVCLFMIIYNIYVHEGQMSLIGNFVVLLMIYFIAYHSLRQKEVYLINPSQKEELVFLDDRENNDQKDKKKLINDDQVKFLKDKLDHYMKNDELYLDSELTLVKLSEIMDITAHQLSYLINEGFNENFFGFVNGYRVAKAKQLLSDSDNRNKTMLAIGFEAGFNSKTAFNSTFKKVTGVTPTQFRNQLQ